MADKILSANELKTILDAERSQGKKVVFTNGCFDIIHAGHVRYLRDARRLGDILVVGLNRDASVSRLKPGRPVNDEESRAEVMAALEMVDYIVLFGEDTPYDLISLLRPDILVKGGDWKREDIVGADLVSEVYSLPFVAGRSTTGIIEKILASKGCQ